MEDLLEYGHQLYNLFIEYKADSIERVKFYAAMREFGISTKSIKLTGLPLTKCVRPNKDSQITLEIFQH